MSKKKLHPRLRLWAAAAKPRILKHVTLEELLVATDAVKERQDVAERLGAAVELTYLRYATPEQIAALGSVLPTTEKRLGGPWGFEPRVVQLFERETLKAVLQVVGVDPDKYCYRGWV